VNAASHIMSRKLHVLHFLVDKTDVFLVDAVGPAHRQTPDFNQDGINFAEKYITDRQLLQGYSKHNITTATPVVYRKICIKTGGASYTDCLPTSKMGNCPLNLRFRRGEDDGFVEFAHIGLLTPDLINPPADPTHMPSSFRNTRPN